MRNRLVSHNMVWDAGFPTHAVQVLKLKAGKLPDCPQWEQTTTLPEPAPTGMGKLQATEAVNRWINKCKQHINDRDLAGAWAAFAETATRYAHHRADKPYTGPRPNSKAVTKPPEPIARGEDCPEDIASHKATKQFHRLQQVCHLWEDNQHQQTIAQKTLAALLNAEGQGSEWRCLLTAARSKEDWQRLVGKAKEVVQAQARVTRQARRDGWYNWCTKQLDRGGSKVFKWIRQGSYEAPFVEGTEWEEQLEEPEQIPSRAVEMTKLRKFWMKLWKPGTDPTHNCETGCSPQTAQQIPHA